jgi:NADP-dependent 3-hydroxy acid dehydrogenase YdfG|tara:strand:- start:1916 stop:2572 length:657 start_codon:yes stop_codon:yes gene_type:complete
MKKQMLLTGASKGVGKECLKYFEDKYDIVSVARSGNVSERGDLRDKEFVEFLVYKYNPSIVINCAAVWKEDYYDILETNFISPAYLTLEFYKKMNRGHIINICSSSANSTGWSGIEYDRINYNISKSAFKKFSNMLQTSKNNSIKVTTIEPAQINTDMGEPVVGIDDSEYEIQTKELVPMKPSYIAEVIDWVLNQPDPVVISSIEIQNFKVIENDSKL